MSAPTPADQPLFSHQTDDEPVEYPHPAGGHEAGDLNAPFSAPDAAS
ncbi:hypothetical protein [Amycolatopsis pithecellobii]|uniref:Uncharacterized protein n=1 Tax=Amycolatopsis pithecellobii TaxID=664692 RepID=A0A6N7Z4N1_9PSEU|nr:hypothetical protein [Amycolatopsis pithecellobii]MTD55334.1 hypothetical protein [Amycolatopsis pithecellobii]